MTKLALLGATGSLGRHVLQQAIAANHEVTVIVRSPAKLPHDVRDKVTVHEADLSHTSIARFATLLAGHEAMVNVAGHVTEGKAFVEQIDRLVTAVESMEAHHRPVCWFMAGAALLDIDASGRRGVDLPGISRTYWPHEVNFERIRHTHIDWRMLCPGPMVEQPALGLDKMRVSLNKLPVPINAFASRLPGALFLPVFASVVPQMIVPYADAAALMLANMKHGDAMSRHRVGLALPVGLRGRKDQWTAKKAP